MPVISELQAAKDALETFEKRFKRKKNEISRLLMEAGALEAKAEKLEKEIFDQCAPFEAEIQKAQEIQSRSLTGWFNGGTTSIYHYRYLLPVGKVTDYSLSWNNRIAWLRFMSVGEGRRSKRLLTIDVSYHYSVGNESSRKTWDHMVLGECDIEECFQLADQYLAECGWNLTDWKPE